MRHPPTAPAAQLIHFFALGPEKRVIASSGIASLIQAPMARAGSRPGRPRPARSSSKLVQPDQSMACSSTLSLLLHTGPNTLIETISQISVCSLR